MVSGYFMMNRGVVGYIHVASSRSSLEHLRGQEPVHIQTFIAKATIKWLDQFVVCGGSYLKNKKAL